MKAGRAAWEEKGRAAVVTIEAAEGGEPEPGPGACEQRRARWDRLADEYAALMADIAADRDRPDLARRVSALTVALREDRAQMAGHVFADAYGNAKSAAPAAAPAAPAGGRHRTRTAPMAKVYHLRPRPAHGLAPAAVLLAGHGTRHVLAAHFRLGLTAAAAASVAAAGITYTIQTTPDRTPLAPAVTAPAVVPSAVALPVPAPARPRTLREHARHAAAPVVTFPAATPPPAATATPPPAPAPGVLNIQQPAVTLQQTIPGQYTGQLTMYAEGGPVRWRIDWLGTSSALQFSQPFGVIPDGQPATITVTVDASAAQSGPWTITLGDGQQITVTAAG